MRTSLILLLAVAPVLLTGCMTISDDFLVKGKERQEIPLGGAKVVLVRCYCPKTSVKTRSGSANLVVDVAGNYGSGGYHGKQDKPKSMPKSLLTFVVRNDGSQLILESRESTYMHHFNLLTTVAITAPSDVAVRFEIIARNDIYDRQVQ